MTLLNFCCSCYQLCVKPSIIYNLILYLMYPTMAKQHRIFSILNKSNCLIFEEENKRMHFRTSLITLGYKQNSFTVFLKLQVVTSLLWSSQKSIQAINIDKLPTRCSVYTRFPPFATAISNLYFCTGNLTVCIEAGVMNLFLVVFSNAAVFSRY